jgi:hypothetical protein
MAKTFLITLDPTTSPGPFNIYYDTISDSNLVAASPSSADKASLLLGVNIVVSDDVNNIYLENLANGCENIELVNVVPPTTTTTTSTTSTTTSTTTAAPTTTTTSTTTDAPTTTTTTAAPTTTTTTATPTTTTSTTTSTTTTTTTTSAPVFGDVTVTNSYLSGPTIESFTPLWFTVTAGSIPVEPNNTTNGTHSNFSGNMAIQISGVSSTGYLLLYINFNLVDQITVTSDGSYTFIGTNIDEADDVFIQLVDVLP